MMDIMAYYKDLLSEKRRKAMQTTLNHFFKEKKSFLPEASASDKPKPGTSTGSYTRPNAPSSSLSRSPSPSPPLSSNVDNPCIQTTFGECNFFFF